MTEHGDGEFGVLDAVSIDELVAELRRRCVAGICIYAHADEDGEWFKGKTWGSMFWRHGISRGLERLFRRKCDLLMDDEEDDEG